MVNKSGRFITVEGIEGSGKTTLLTHIYHLIINAGYPALITREPGGTTLGEELRKIILAPKNADITADSELLLLFAARAEHLAQVIRPSLVSGKWVICDRFTDATYAYQGGGRGIARDRIECLEKWTQGELRPDLTLLLDIPVNLGLTRIKQRANLDRFEQEKHAFHERVRAAYLELAYSQPKRFQIINAALPIIEVERIITQLIQEIIARMG